MNETKTCSRCGKPMARGDLMGLCPDCLLAVGLGTVADATAAGSVPRFSPPAIETLAPLFPRLDIEALLGCGGMGAVYRARQRGLDRLVALKILPTDIGRDPAFAARFAREAQSLARLNHPNIVTLYEFGQAGDLFFFLMEYVDGVNLGQVIRAGRMAPREALAVVPQICDALQYAHDHGVVHRDIKPENILLDRQGRVKVADFGVAKLVRAPEPPGAAVPAAGGSDELSQGGLVMGTPAYMAPEQREPADRGGPSRGHLFAGRGLRSVAHGRTAGCERRAALAKGRGGRAARRNRPARAGAEPCAPLSAGERGEDGVRDVGVFRACLRFVAGTRRRLF